MTNEALQQLIGSWFPNPEAEKQDHNQIKPETEAVADGQTEPSKPINPSFLEFSEEESQFLNMTVPPKYLHALMHQLKHHQQTQCDYLFCLTGVDWEPELGVVYHLESTVYRHIVVVKVKTEDRDNPTFDSVHDIWRTAEFHEREVFDFFGIKFNNHPNLKRLFLTENWEGFPLRKDYVDDINMVIK